jgi:hypothetical protein
MRDASSLPSEDQRYSTGGVAGKSLVGDIAQPLAQRRVAFEKIHGNPVLWSARAVAQPTLPPPVTNAGL